MKERQSSDHDFLVPMTLTLVIDVRRERCFLLLSLYAHHVLAFFPLLPSFLPSYTHIQASASFSLSPCLLCPIKATPLFPLLNQLRQEMKEDSRKKGEN